MKANVMRMPTWRYLKLNSVELEQRQFEKKDYKYVESSKEQSDYVKDLFSNKNYGLSEDKLEEVDKFSNVKIYKEVKEDKDTEIFYYDTDKDNNEIFSTIDINAKENTSSSYMLSFNSKDDYKAYVNSLVRINLEKNSKVKLLIIANLSSESENNQQISSIIGENASLELSYIELGAASSFVNYKNFLEGRKSKLDFDGVYFKENEDYIDMLVTNEHQGEDSSSNTIFNGALKDSANKAWKGIVDLKRGCKRADGKIGDYAMLLSDDVVNKTTPILLCEEDKVKGNHAASVGRLNKEMLYYIMSRGLSKKQAESMILEASFTPTLDKIEDESLKDELKKKVHSMNNRGL